MHALLAWIAGRSHGRVRPASVTRSSCFAPATSFSFASAISVGSSRPQRSRPSAAVGALYFIILLRNSFLGAGGPCGGSCSCLGAFVGPAMATSAEAFGSWRIAGVAACSIFEAAPRRSRSSFPSCFACPTSCPRQRNAPPLAMVVLALYAWSRRGLRAAGVFCLNHPTSAVHALPAS